MSEVYDFNKKLKIVKENNKKDEEGNPIEIYKAVNEEGVSLWTAKKVYNWYSSDGKTNYKWSIWGKKSSVPEKLEGIKIPVGSLLVDWEYWIIYIMTDTGWKPFE